MNDNLERQRRTARLVFGWPTDPDVPHAVDRQLASRFRVGSWLLWAYENLPERSYLQTLAAARSDQQREARKRRKKGAL